MAELIENVMDFARGRLGAGMMLNRQPTLLEPVFRHVVDELRIAWPKEQSKPNFTCPTLSIVTLPASRKFYRTCWQTR